LDRLNPKVVGSKSCPRYRQKAQVNDLGFLGFRRGLTVRFTERGAGSARLNVGPLAADGQLDAFRSIFSC
jgi:hypothetical protein